MYAKIINNKLTFANIKRGSIETPTSVIINPTEENLIENGYKICINTQQPIKDGFYYTSRWEEQEDSFLQVWDEHPIPIQQIVAELKQQLADTDYKAIKYAEGWISEEDYAPIKAQRQALRDKINEYENK